MARSVVGVLFAAVAAAVPVLVVDVHGSAIIILAILAAGSGGGIYVLASKKVPLPPHLRLQLKTMPQRHVSPQL